MEIVSSFAGTRLKTFRKKVCRRDTMNYAAAVGDDNPLYFDDQREGGVVAPPMYAVSVTWPVVEGIHAHIEAQDFPKEVLSTLVHYTEHLEFYRPILPGDQLVVDGRVAAILPRRAGTHIVIRFEVKDDAGNPVFTEHIGAMLRGVKCMDSGRGGNSIPVVPDRNGNGPLIWESSISIDRLRPFIYDGCTDIVFPIHTSEKFARQVGLPGIILQGTATLAYAVREIINREADKDPIRVRLLFCRFSGMVFPGTTIRVILDEIVEQASGRGLYFSVINQDGKKAISNGYVFLSNEEGPAKNTGV